MVKRPLKDLGVGLGPNPNRHAAAPVAGQVAGEASCMLKGRTYPHGGQVCWLGNVWVCDNGIWDPTGHPCQG